MSDEQVIRRFHQIWYEAPDTWRSTKWLGLGAAQNPMDVWVIQEILSEQKPDYFIECGAWQGGSAALWATILEQINSEAKVISIDIEDEMQQARELPIIQRRVEFIIGDSTDPAIVDRIRKQVAGKKAVVLLDSDHRKSHVLQELRSYAPMVNVGSYIIVQDTNVNGNPVEPNFEDGVGGPMEAVAEFLAGNDSFRTDASRERMLFTFSPNGYLRRVK